MSNLRRIFSIRDVKTGVYGEPIVVPHLVTIERQLKTVLTDDNNMLCKYPEDYQLFEVGQFNPETGFITVAPQPHFIANIIDYKPSKSMAAQQMPMSFAPEVNNG